MKKETISLGLISICLGVCASCSNSNAFVKVKSLVTDTTMPLNENRLLNENKHGLREDDAEDELEYGNNTYALVNGAETVDITVLLSNPKDETIRAVEFESDNPNTKICVNDGYGNNNFLFLNDVNIKGVVNWTSMSAVKMTYTFMLEGDQTATNIRIKDIKTDRGWQNKRQNNNLTVYHAGTKAMKLEIECQDFSLLSFKTFYDDSGNVRYFLDDGVIRDGDTITLTDNNPHFLYEFLYSESDDLLAKYLCGLVYKTHFGAAGDETEAYAGVGLPWYDSSIFFKEESLDFCKDLIHYFELTTNRQFFGRAQNIFTYKDGVLRNNISHVNRWNGDVKNLTDDSDRPNYFHCSLALYRVRYDGQPIGWDEPEFHGDNVFYNEGKNINTIEYNLPPDDFEEFKAKGFVANTFWCDIIGGKEVYYEAEISAKIGELIYESDDGEKVFEAVLEQISKKEVEDDPHYGYWGYI